METGSLLRNIRSIQIIGISMAAVLVLEILFGITNGRGLEWDFANFYDAGHKAWHREFQNLYNPTALIGGQLPQGNKIFFGVPLSSMFYVPLAWLPPSTALVLFKVQSALANLLGLALLYYQVKPFNQGANGHSLLALFVIAATIFQPFWTIFYVGGQTTPAVFLLFTLALWFHSRENGIASTLCVLIAVAIKPAFILVPILLAMLSGRRVLYWTAAWSLVLGVLSVAVMGWSIQKTFVSSVLSQRPVMWRNNSSITVVFDNIIRLTSPENPFPYLAASTVVRLSVIGLLLWLMLRERSRLEPGPQRRQLDFILSITSGLILVPVIWEHYVSFLFIPLAYCLAISTKLPRRGTYLLWGIIFASSAHHVEVLYWLYGLFVTDTLFEMIVTGVFKGIPLASTALLFMIYRKEIINALSPSERDKKGAEIKSFADQVYSSSPPHHGSAAPVMKI